MFVPYDSDKERPFCFKVQRSTDRCVCGSSAIITSFTYPDSGYCPKCSEKREEFVDKIIGNIDLGPQNSIENLILTPIEQMRKFMLKEIMYYMVDSHFAFHDRSSGDYKEPYDIPEFIVHCICEKSIATESLLKCINEPETKILKMKPYNNVVTAQISYLNKVKEMLEMDLDNKNALSASTYGYPYKRKYIAK